jgi:hypothetical protein
MSRGGQQGGERRLHCCCRCDSCSGISAGPAFVAGLGFDNKRGTAGQQYKVASLLLWSMRQGHRLGVSRPPLLGVNIKRKGNRGNSTRLHPVFLQSWTTDMTCTHKPSLLVSVMVVVWLV